MSTDETQKADEIQQTPPAAPEETPSVELSAEPVVLSTEETDRILVEAEAAVEEALETLAAVSAEAPTLIDVMAQTTTQLEERVAQAETAHTAATADDEDEEYIFAEAAKSADIEEEPAELEIPDAAETAEQLEELAVAMAVEHRRAEADLIEEAGAEEAAAQVELIQQIAEDNAIEAHQQAVAVPEPEPVDENLLAALPKVDDEGNLDLQELESCIEALVFLSERPISRRKLREHLGPEIREELFDDAIAALYHKYQSPAHGIELAEVAGGIQLRTKPGRAALAKKLVKTAEERLSRGAMETLAIVAYRQPVMKEDVDKVRGVDSSHFVRRLLEKKLIEISGRSELPGRPMLYNTTDRFLEVFGLKDLSAMPPLRELEQMIPSSETKNPDDVDPKIKEMRRLVGEMTTDRTQLQYNSEEDERFLMDIRERVKGIPVSTPYLQELAEAERAAAETGESVPVTSQGQHEIAAVVDPAAEATETASSAASSAASDDPEASL
ncbi:MAG: SMC-Scp complex subunit ScpB [Bdellovibrionales bacterium]|nr:SMC-Scp complex subunit ScpB [Bdellovibrionales bacterium]